MFKQAGFVVILVGRLDPVTGVIHGLVVDPSACRRQVMPPRGVLTARQVEVAELVTQGLSNKDIATKLTISQRTAEGHVENILVKLCLTSRTQLAVWFTENVARHEHGAGGNVCPGRLQRVEAAQEP